MKSNHMMPIIGIICSIMAISGIIENEAFAMNAEEIMKEMKKLDEKLVMLKNTDGEFKEKSMGSIGFEIKQIKNTLLKINVNNNEKNDQVNEKYDTVRENFNQIIDKYEKDVKKHQKENGLTIQEKKLKIKF